MGPIKIKTSQMQNWIQCQRYSTSIMIFPFFVTSPYSFEKQAWFSR